MKTTSRRELIIPSVRAAAILVFLVLSAGAGKSRAGQDEARLAVTAESVFPQVAFGSPVSVKVTIKNIGKDANSLVPAQMASK